jgi:hypothetical protein
MDIKVVRYEKYKNLEGEINSIFLAISITDNGNSFYYEKWITEKEDIDKILQDENNIQEYIEQAVKEAIIKMEEEKRNKPPEPEVADIKKLEDLSKKININKISKEVEKELENEN